MESPTKIKDLRWKKAYHGPFLKDQAEELCKDLCERQPIGIKGARIRLRKRGKNRCVCTAACGAGLGHNMMYYDVYINVHRDWRDTTKHGKK